MLCSIDEGFVEDCRRILTLLCFAERPLTLPELIDGIAVELDGPARLNRKRRLQDANDIREICLGLIDVDVDIRVDTSSNVGSKAGSDAKLYTDPHTDLYAGSDAGTDAQSDTDSDIDSSADSHAKSNFNNTEYTKTEYTYYTREPASRVRIAHFSVQEYLMSERMRYQKASAFSLDRCTAHTEIAQICLVYLLDPGFSSSKEFKLREELPEYPLIHYAIRYWHDHYTQSPDYASKLDYAILELFKNPNGPFQAWIRLRSPTTFYRKTVSPIYYVSLLGFDRVLLQLINQEQGKSQIKSKFQNPLEKTIFGLLDAEGGFHGNALQAASFNGHESVVQILLDRNADINAPCGPYGNALQVASFKGHEPVVKLLLDHNTDVNATAGPYGNALQLACSWGRKEVVQLLLKRGANVYAPFKPFAVHWSGRHFMVT